MKKLLIAFAALLATSTIYGWGSNADFNTVTVSSNVAISTTSWTKIPTTNSRYRKAVLLDNVNSNSADMLMTFTMSDTAPTVSTTTGSSLMKDEAPVIMSIGEKIRIWLISLHTASEDVFYLELK